MLDPDQGPAERHDCLKVILRSGEHLLSLLNDILDLSKIEAGRLEIERITCSPVEIANDMATLIRRRAKLKKLTFSLRYEGAIPRAISSDPTRIRQVLLNLLGNAVKFTEAGGVTLLVSTTAGDRPTLRFAVSDTGPGLSAESRENLFQSFFQADTSTTRRYGGTGLGLSISQRLARMLGGGIEVASAPGEGSTFTFSLPIDAAAEAQPVEQPLASVEESQFRLRAIAPQLEGCRVLLAEDSPDNQRLISFILKKAGAEVVLADNGQIACAKALEAMASPEPFDVILMDMQMPVMDGYAAASYLRAHRYPGRVIALTAHTMDGDRERCIEAGCNDYAAKPIDRQNLVSAIHAHWHRRGPGTSRITNSVDRGWLVSPLAEDPDFVALVANFVNDLPTRVAAIERALAEDDRKQLHTIAHQLKGVAAGYGFPAISDQAKAVMELVKTAADRERIGMAVHQLVSRCRRAKAGK
jgi:CheY-like chemotaxis protein/HPt (histidine-containing phosphotransfer) domain-containing protein